MVIGTQPQNLHSGKGYVNCDGSGMSQECNVYVKMCHVNKLKVL